MRERERERERVNLRGMRLTTVSVIERTEMRHLSARGSKMEPTLDDWEGKCLAINPSNWR